MSSYISAFFPFLMWSESENQPSAFSHVTKNFYPRFARHGFQTIHLTFLCIMTKLNDCRLWKLWTGVLYLSHWISSVDILVYLSSLLAKMSYISYIPIFYATKLLTHWSFDCWTPCMYLIIKFTICLYINFVTIMTMCLVFHLNGFIGCFKGCFKGHTWDEGGIKLV